MIIVITVIDVYIMFFCYSSKTEVRFPVNIGITGHVATTGEVMQCSIEVHVTLRKANGITKSKGQNPNSPYRFHTFLVRSRDLLGSLFFIFFNLLRSVCCTQKSRIVKAIYSN